MQLDWSMRVLCLLRSAVVFIALTPFCLFAIGGSSPPLQGWINVYAGSAFHGNINSACPTGKIEQYWYDPGLHRCLDLPPAAADAIGWGWVCPKQSKYVEFTSYFTCNPNLSGGPFATCSDGTTMVGVADWHPIGSNLPDVLGDRCPSSKAPDVWALALAGPATTIPENGKGNSEAMYTARLTKNGDAAPNMPLDLSVAVTLNSGGHLSVAETLNSGQLLHDINRPKGALSIASATTDAKGEVKFSFKPPEFAGVHTVKVNCSTCSNLTATKDIHVKVPDLQPISPNPPQNADGSFVYALTSVDETHQGNGRHHVNQYYLTDISGRNLLSLIRSFAEAGWGTVALNDASLLWGGRYDINAKWSGSHAGHREGREIDISFARARNPISPSKQNDFYDKFCKSKKVSFPFSILHHYVESPHFHVYLEKQTACFKSEK